MVGRTRWVRRVDGASRSAPPSVNFAIAARAALRIPRVFKFIMQCVSPLFLGVVLLMFVLSSVFGWNFSFAAPHFAPTGRITDLVGAKHSDVARITVAFILVGVGFSALLMHLAGKRWTALPPEKQL